MAKPVEFIREVRQEMSKVTWPSRKETMITTAMVFVMIFFMGLILLAADAIISELVQLVLNIGG